MKYAKNAIAKNIGTSIKRIERIIRKLEIEPTRIGNFLYYSYKDVERIRAEFDKEAKADVVPKSDNEGSQESLRSAFSCGYYARKNGESITKNPHEADALFTAWYRGWNHAKNEARGKYQHMKTTYDYEAHWTV